MCKGDGAGKGGVGNHGSDDGARRWGDRHTMWDDPDRSIVGHVQLGPVDLSGVYTGV